MVGVGKALIKVYEQQVAGGISYTRASSKPNTDKDIKDFIELMLPENIFTSTPGRIHNAFPDFEFKLYPKVVVKGFKARMEKHRKNWYR
ncbi:hypothetical protein KUTeg_023905 [Tegillarca granosa]|uniref:Uncharacterized protein n=1 Tax=Tegillarca granosa TaxID=220873 RepID=A0ABQ9E026_TEGGR|nr:hypothetical protein KUTeg_023905 [Tegillarca granosa]